MEGDMGENIEKIRREERGGGTGDGKKGGEREVEEESAEMEGGREEGERDLINPRRQGATPVRTILISPVG